MARPKRIMRARRYDGKHGQQFSISIPADIGRLLFANNVIDFAVELTDDGLLFRPIHHAPEEAQPDWLRPAP